MNKKLTNELVIGNRSKAEQLLIDYLRFHFKKLKILPNDKSAVGKEIDIFLPEYKIGIECDGIFHYLPVHGEETLAKIQARDLKKDKLCEDAGIKLIRITLPEDSKIYPEFIKEEVKNRIAPMIKEWILTNQF
jgi:very-short-patch-repair endonuclease